MRNIWSVASDSSYDLKLELQSLSRFSDSNEYISVVESIHHDETGSDDTNIIDKVDTVEPFKEAKTIDYNEIYMIGLALVSLASSHCEV